MTTVLEQYKTKSRRRRRQAASHHQRLDIQGLRMVAVLTVFANHLWGQPHGGFVGVDVFFVISGFLITGNLLRDAEKRGTVSFRQFYWNRVRRIVPAATAVLILTYIAATLLFMPFRSREVGIDALWAFGFMSNWWFGYQGTDYFRAAADTVSPIQHYWSLSIEEQFYFVWPVLIFLISIVVVRKAWTHEKRMRIAGTTMAVIVALSLGWALYETATSPAWAYFNTFARAWELGVGALLACSIGLLARIPTAIRPWLSWAGLAFIAASVVLIGEGVPGFPAPWALLPVLGSAMVIAAGVGEEPEYQAFLRNPVSGYIGDISYSLYLVHWPVIVMVGTLMEPGLTYSITVLCLGFGLAIASYHFVENPLRRADWTKLQVATRELRERRFDPSNGARFAGLGVLVLVTLALSAFVLRPNQYVVNPQAFEPDQSVSAEEAATEVNLGPQATALQIELAAALKADQWPSLTPSMESLATDPAGQESIFGCYGNEPLTDPGKCAWGAAKAPTKIVVVGDSIAGSYAVPLREIANNSGGQVHVYTLALGGCLFTDRLVHADDAERMEACPGRKQAALDFINSTKPQLVLISNTYQDRRFADAENLITPKQWADSTRAIIDQFRGNVRNVALLSPPPLSPKIAECYGQRGSVPGDCAGEVTRSWVQMAQAEQGIAEAVGGVWIDSRPWFCSGPYCPAFAGPTPTKLDEAHIVPAYGVRIAPAIEESLRSAGAI